MTLTEFLTARLDEDTDVYGDPLVVERWVGERMLREVAAKRVILARCQMVLAAFDDRENGEWPDVTRRERSHARRTLDDLAAVYSDHPDYDPAWA